MRTKTLPGMLEARRRKSLAASLEGVIRSVDPKWLPGASPLNRSGLRAYVPELRALAERVGDVDRPASRRGLRLVRALLTDGGSPLYDRERIHELPAMIKTIAVALEIG